MRCVVIRLSKDRSLDDFLVYGVSIEQMEDNLVWLAGDGIELKNNKKKIGFN